MIYDLTVVGAGASGCLASIRAAEKSLSVLLLEKNERIGQKLLTTGNGRCNYTNKNITVNNYHGNEPDFVKYALSKYNHPTILSLFEKMGIIHYALENGKCYPYSLQSSSFLDVFRMELKEQGVDLKTCENVKQVSYKGDHFIIESSGGTYRSKKLIVATGGLSLPKSGSDGGGYKLLKYFSHSLTDTFPALVQLKLEYPYLKAMDGVKLEAKTRLWIDDQEFSAQFGDTLFTSYGISGPTILNLSRDAVEGVLKNKKVEVSVSLLAQEPDEIFNIITSRFSHRPKRTVEEALIGMVHKKLILPFLKDLGIPKEMSVKNLSQEKILEMKTKLSDWRFRVIGHNGFANSQVTCGGIRTSEFNGETMESKLQRGLYGIGEVLDIDGDCGGYNLHWAWASASVAVDDISQKIGRKKR